MMTCRGLGGTLRIPTLVVTVVLLVSSATASAQQLAGAGNNGLDIAQGAMRLPPIPPQGAWGEVIMANAKWIVVQNHEGQQFPISTNSINQFLIRWPTNLAALTPNSVVEAIGIDLGSNFVKTDHVDVFEDTNQTLVAPTYAQLLPDNRTVTTIDPTYNRFMNGFDIGAQNLLYGWAYPINPGADLGVPARMHAVGFAIANNPLRLRVIGNNIVTVVPADPGIMSLTEVTRGNSSFAEKGDLVYLMPTQLTPRTVVLSQLVLYKTMSRRDFRLP